MSQNMYGVPAQVYVPLGSGTQYLAAPTTGLITAVADGHVGEMIRMGCIGHVKVVALTLEGYQNSSVLNGVATSKNLTGADGKPFTLSGGSSNVSLESSGQAVTSATNMLAASVAPVVGASAYAWFISAVNAAGTETLQQITTINSMTQPGPLLAGTQSVAQITADNSSNPN